MPEHSQIGDQNIRANIHEKPWSVPNFTCQRRWTHLQIHWQKWKSVRYSRQHHSTYFTQHKRHEKTWIEYFIHWKSILFCSYSLMVLLFNLSLLMRLLLLLLLRSSRVSLHGTKFISFVFFYSVFSFNYLFIFSSSWSALTAEWREIDVCVCVSPVPVCPSSCVWMFVWLCAWYLTKRFASRRTPNSVNSMYDTDYASAEHMYISVCLCTVYAHTKLHYTIV